jgi:argininosuccinate lyase
MAKLWGGRFEGGTHADVEEFTSSLALDSRLAQADLRGCLAHARMLGRQGILTQSECTEICLGLEAIASGLKSGSLAIPQDAEDIHTAIEMLLSARIGAVAGKLHTARSRNDQVATACRLYLRDQIDQLQSELRALQSRFVNLSQGNIETVLPGMTHLQHAQPVSLAHHLMAYFWMLERDHERLADLRGRVNQMPLGSGALAGTTLPIEREGVAAELGFEGLCENSLDAVSDRDFVVEFLAAAALIGTHLSRFSEELILWSMPEFGFIELADDVTTGSSLMPQKKNPDVAELIRGRTGRLTGALMGALTLLKALPLSYNRDLQEDKQHLFEGLDTVRAAVRLTSLMLEKARFRTDRMERACYADYSNTTDLADYLVRKGIPFRQTHEIAGRAVRLAIEKKVALEELTLSELKSLHPDFEEDVFASIQTRAVMQARNSRGGTGTRAVAEQIQRAEVILGKGVKS